jgi:error-prone DNA polymerase
VPFSSIDDLWRRAKVPVTSLVELADGDAMKEAFGLPRREALWAIKALRDEPLELWSAAAQRVTGMVQELDEPDVEIRPMTAGGEVVEDYRHVGLSLRRHPVEFLRADLTGRHIVTCAEAMAARDADGWRQRVSSWSDRDRAQPRESCSSPSRTRPASLT